MRYDFLKKFPERMKSAGRYAVLVRNITAKTGWKDYGDWSDDDRINLVFSILLFIMEKSLREEICTIDDIAVFVDDINGEFYRRELDFDKCRELADFIVDRVLSNEGLQMTFEGYDYEHSSQETISIRYLKNSIAYGEGDVRRTSYMLTDDGYNLLLSTLEVESNLKITIQEMIFRLHLEKQSYDKAVDDIRNIFHHIRIQYQKISDAMQRIRKNALEYSVEEYQSILGENLDVVEETKSKFEGYRKLVANRVREFEEEDIDASGLSDADEDKLRNLKQIGMYLDRTIDEHQRILGSHMDLKDLYSKELENLSQVAKIKRFSLRNDVYDRLLEEPEALEDMNIILAPLFFREASKIYNPDKIFNPHRLIRKKKDEDITENIEFDEAKWEAEQERLREEKRKKYESSLGYIIRELVKRKEMTLEDLGRDVQQKQTSLDDLIPDTDIFKEVMVELLKGQYIDIAALKKERGEVIGDYEAIFEVSYMLLDLLERYDRDGRIKAIKIERLEKDDMVVFENTMTAEGFPRNIRCSNVRFTALT